METPSGPWLTEVSIGCPHLFYTDWTNTTNRLVSTPGCPACRMLSLILDDEFFQRNRGAQWCFHQAQPPWKWHSSLRFPGLFRQLAHPV
jgi:hypothetical protein